MKTYKNLYPKIHEFENLYLAYRKARRGKRNQPAIAAFEIDLEESLFSIQNDLITAEYQPGPYRHFTIYERKPRRISAAPFPYLVI